MNHLVLDLGNTRMRAYHYRDGAALKEWELGRLEELPAIVSQLPQPLKILASNVGKYSFAGLREAGLEVLEVGQMPHLPVELKYQTPETLGSDRIALACGAQDRYPAHNVLIIDVGTCITYDFKNAAAQYLGGAISPGVLMRFEAMHHFTARLPLIGKWNERPNELMGSTTEQSMQIGVWAGIDAEIAGIIKRYQSRYPKLKVLFTGGAGKRFAQELNFDIFAAPKLLPEGLNYILEFNA